MVLLRLGHWIAFVITCVSVAVFVVGIASSLRRRKEQLLEARDRSARTDRLRSVGTLAAAAAHELNTPLSTLSLRLRRIGRRHGDQETGKDVEAMREQLERCSSIVQRLLVGAGDPSASDIERRELSAMVEEAVRLWAKGSTLGVELLDESDGFVVELPGVAFQQALINLLENARRPRSRCPLRSAGDPGRPRRVRRRGRALRSRCGLPPVPDQVGEPFFTTKPPGRASGCSWREPSPTGRVADYSTCPACRGDGRPLVVSGGAAEGGMTGTKLLVVDDDDAFREAMELEFTDRGYQVLCAVDQRSALGLATLHRPSFAVVDLRLENDRGSRSSAISFERVPGIRCVMLTGTARSPPPSRR